MVSVRVNGAGPYWFVVDSGASRTVLDAALAKEIGLKITGEGSTTGTGQGAVPLAFVGKVDVSLGGLTYAAEPYVIDLSGTPLSKEVRGLVGLEIFKSLPLTLMEESCSCRQCWKLALAGVCVDSSGSIRAPRLR